MSRILKFPFIFLLFVGFVGCNATNILVKSNRAAYPINATVGVDSSIIKTYEPYKAVLEKEMNRIVGYSDVDLVKASSTPESVIGNFYADAIYHQVKKIIPNVDFVFPTTKGGIRNDIPKGPILVSQVFEMMPFENQLVLFELKGSDVDKIARMIAASNGQPVAGLTMNIKGNLPENVKINGQAFDVNKTYWVVTSDYLAGGGDDTQGFSKPISRKNIGLLVRDALIREVEDLQAAGKKINSKLDGRITKN